MKNNMKGEKMGNYREMIYSKNLEILNNMKNSNYWEKIPNAKFNTPINGNMPPLNPGDYFLDANNFMLCDIECPHCGLSTMIASFPDGYWIQTGQGKTEQIKGVFACSKCFSIWGMENVETNPQIYYLKCSIRELFLMYITEMNSKACLLDALVMKYLFTSL